MSEPVGCPLASQPVVASVIEREAAFAAGLEAGRSFSDNAIQAARAFDHGRSDMEAYMSASDCKGPGVVNMIAELARFVVREPACDAENGPDCRREFLANLVAGMAANSAPNTRDCSEQ